MPGSMAELKPLVLVISFLGLFALLISIIPGQFFTESYGGRGVDVPEYFEAVDITSFFETYNFTIDDKDMFQKEWDLGGHNWIMNADYGDEFIGLGKKNYWWFLWVGTEKLIFRSSRGINRGQFLNRQELDADYDNTTSYCEYVCEGEDNPSLSTTMYFGYNTSLYDTPSEAWENEELYVLQGLGFDQVSTSRNAWNLVGMILFFQMPDVHPIINAIIAIPLWVSIVYLTYVLILKAIPFVSG